MYVTKSWLSTKRYLQKWFAPPSNHLEKCFAPPLHPPSKMSCPPANAEQMYASSIAWSLSSKLPLIIIEKTTCLKPDKICENTAELFDCVAFSVEATVRKCHETCRWPHILKVLPCVNRIIHRMYYPINTGNTFKI